MSQGNDLLSVTLFDNPDKGIQYRLTISQFYDTTYLSVREFYQEYDGSFAPTKNGLHIPYTLHTTSRLYDGLSILLSQAETLEEVQRSGLGVVELSQLAEVSQALSEVGMVSDSQVNVLEIDKEARSVKIGVTNEETDGRSD